MSPARVRMRVVALLAAAALAACAETQPAPPTVTAPSSANRTTPTAHGEPGEVSFEIGGPPGSHVVVSWGLGNVTAHTKHPIPWSRTEIAPMTPFAVTLQATLDPASNSNVNCRITFEGREIANKTLPGGALCTAMNLTRANGPTS